MLAGLAVTTALLATTIMFMLLTVGSARASLSNSPFSLADPLTGSVAETASNDELIVGFNNGKSSAQESSAVDNAGGQIDERLDSIDAAVVSADGSQSLDDLARELRNSSAVRYVEPNFRAQLLQTPNDPSFTTLWGMHNTGQSSGVADADIDAPEAWDTSTDANLIVAISDTGIDYNHPDLANNVWTNAGEIPGNGIDDDSNGSVDDIHGYDYYNEDGDPFDDHSHGTHVSGTIGGVGNNATGVAGVSWTTKLMGVKFLSAGGSGSYSDGVRSIDYAVTNGAKVINASWGGSGYSQALKDSIQRAGASGVLFVAAAGNSANNADQIPMYPAAYDLDNIVSVAASTRSETLAYFSNYGTTSVDLAAPGYLIYSTTPNNGYATFSGTSMASPHVAGASALYRAANPGLTPSQVRVALMATADDKPAYNGKTVSGGRLNVNSLLPYDGTLPPPDPPDDPDPPEDNCPADGGGAGSGSEDSEGQAGDGATSIAEGRRQLIVKFKDDASAQQERSAVAAAGAGFEERIDSENNLTVVKANPDESRTEVEKRLNRSSFIEYAEPDRKIRRLRTPNDPYFSQLWGLDNDGAPYGRRDADIDGPEAWDEVTSTGDVVVAVSDTGVDYNHSDLNDNMWTNTAETPNNGVDDDCNGFIDDVHGIDSYNDDGDPIDDHGHGTHVAGTIGAEGNNSIGVAGVAWNTKIMAIKFLSRYGYGYTSDAIETINYAVDNGANVINASWGGGGYSQALKDSISAANDQGVVFVAAAGNNGRNTDSYNFYPAGYDVPNVVSVGASTIYEAMPYFSNYGASSVELVAPGYSIYSTYRNNSYATMSGTSMAAPHVAGAVAMYLGQNPNSTPSQVKAQLIATVDQKPAYENKTVSDGRLNLAKLLGIEYEEPCSMANSSGAGDTTAEEASQQLIVGFKKGAKPSQEQAAVASVDVSVAERIDEINAAVVNVDPGQSRAEAAKQLRKSDAVEYAEPNSRMKLFRTPNDPMFPQLWGLNNPTNGADINAPETWNRYTGSGNVVVAVIDTGIDYNHSDLNDNMWTNTGEIPDNCQDDDGNGYADDVYGFDFHNYDSDPMDDNLHGTHVAGTIGAEGNNGTGVVGVNWNTKLMAVKFLSSGGYGYLSNAVNAINYAADNGADVMNNSWGGGGYSYSLYYAIRRAKQMGVVFVAAAGNSGMNTDYWPAYPASYDLDNIVSVAASNSYDRLAYFSNYGKTTVDLAAPGQSIYSTTPGNSYRTLSGTSMASPHVAGAAAMYLANRPGTSPSAVRQHLIDRADDKGAFTNKTASNGRLNLERLFVADQARPPSSGTPPPAATPPKRVNPEPVKPPKKKPPKSKPKSKFKLLIPAPNAVFSTLKPKRRVHFRWKKVKGAKRYILYIDGKRRKVIRGKKSHRGKKSRAPKTSTNLYLRPAKYRWSVRAVLGKKKSRLAVGRGKSGKKQRRWNRFKVLTPSASRARAAKASAMRRAAKRAAEARNR